MQDAIVFGCGGYYRKKKGSICTRYNIIAFLDNGLSGKEPPKKCEDLFVYKPKSVQELPDVPIIVMVSDKYLIEVFNQLLSLHVSAERIIFGANLLPAVNVKEELLQKTEACIRARGRSLELHFGDNSISFSNEKEYKEAFRYLRACTNTYVKSLIQMPVAQAGKDFGGEYGTPVDRWYIERFLDSNRGYIHGDVLEIAESTYTYKFGTNIKQAYKLHVNGSDGCTKGNLANGEGIIPDMADCFICTQTLQFIYDIHSAVRNIHKLLRPGGVALITAHGISQIAMYSYRNWGEYWRFTEQSMRLLMEEVFEKDKIEICRYGNVKTAMAFLYGLCQEDLSLEDFEPKDEMFQLILGAVCVK